MRKHSQSLVKCSILPVGRYRIVLITELCYSRGDRIIQASIQSAKLVGFNAFILLQRKLGNRLAHIAVVVNHLLDTKT